MRDRPAGEWVALPPEIAPALVAPELWQRANDQLAVGQRFSYRRNPEPQSYLLRAGFVRCGSCGGAMCAVRVGGKPTYVCKQRSQNGCTSSSSMRAEELDAFVWNTVTQVLKDPAWIRQQLEEQANSSSLNDHLSAAQAGLQKMRQEEKRLAARLGELDDPTPAITRLNEVSTRRKTAEAEIDDLLFQRQHAEQISRRLNGFDQRFLDAYERVDAMTYEEKRIILQEFKVKVTLWKRDHDPRFAIDWAFDLGDDWWREDDDKEDLSWVMWTAESTSLSKHGLGFSSSA